MDYEHNIMVTERLSDARSLFGILPKDMDINAIKLERLIHGNERNGVTTMKEEEAEKKD